MLHTFTPAHCTLHSPDFIWCKTPTCCTLHNPCSCTYPWPLRSVGYTTLSPTLYALHTHCDFTLYISYPALSLAFSKIHTIQSSTVYITHSWPLHFIHNTLLVSAHWHESQSAQGDWQRQRTHSSKVPQPHCTSPGETQYWDLELHSDTETNFAAAGIGILVAEDDQVCKSQRRGAQFCIFTLGIELFFSDMAQGCRLSTLPGPYFPIGQI